MVGKAAQIWDLHPALMEGFNVSFYKRQAFKDDLHLIPGLIVPLGNFPNRTSVSTETGVEKG